MSKKSCIAVSTAVLAAVLVLVWIGFFQNNEERTYILSAPSEGTDISEPLNLESAPKAEEPISPVSSAPSLAASSQTKETSSSAGSSASSASSPSSLNQSSSKSPMKPVSSKPADSSKPAPSSQSASSKPHVSRPSSLPSVSSRPNSHSGISSSVGGVPSSFTQKVVVLTNQERIQEGLEPLTISKSAAEAAAVRAKEIAESFSHTRPDGRSFSTALKDQGVSYRSAGENIAWGQTTPEEVVTGWMNSSGHRANILSSKFTSIGVGFYRSSSGRTYWVQLFVG